MDVLQSVLNQFSPVRVIVDYFTKPHANAHKIGWVGQIRGAARCFDHRAQIAGDHRFTHRLGLDYRQTETLVCGAKSDNVRPPILIPQLFISQILSILIFDAIFGQRRHLIGREFSDNSQLALNTAQGLGEGWNILVFHSSDLENRRFDRVKAMTRASVDIRHEREIEHMNFVLGTTRVTDYFPFRVLGDRRYHIELLQRPVEVEFL